MKRFSKIQAYLTNKEIIKRFLITVVLLFAFRLLSKVPAPGVEKDALKNLFGGNTEGFFNIANILAGGTLTQFSIISVGMIAFVNASIIMQLLGTVVPRIEQIQKMGETGRKMINQWTRLLTVPLAGIQSFGIYLLLKSTNNPTGQPLIADATTLQIVALIFVLTAGAMLLMWIAELISEEGFGGKQGGGVGVIVTAGILASLPTSITQAFSNITTSEFLRNAWIAFGIENLIFALLLLIFFGYIYIGKKLLSPKSNYLRSVGKVVLTVLILIIPAVILTIVKVDPEQSKLIGDIKEYWSNYTARLDNIEIRFGFYLGLTIQLIALITFFNESLRKVPIKFIHRIRSAGASNSTYESESYLPVKILAAGVIPIIFATSLLLLPQVIYKFFGSWIDRTFVNFGPFMKYLSEGWLNQQTSVYFHILQFILIILFSFFYIFVILKPENIADDLKRSQSFIPSVRPGKETVEYLSNVIARVTFWGGIILALISSLPFLLGIYNTNVSSGMEAFIGGGTSILIVVSTILAVKIQLDAIVLTKNYEQFEEI